MSRPTVWTVIPFFYPDFGGAERQAQVISGALASRGWPVRVLTRRHGVAALENASSRDMVDGVPVTRVFSRGGKKVGSLIFILGGLLHLALHGRRGIYHAHDIGAPAWLAVLARYLLRGRCLVKLRSGRQLYDQRLTSPLARLQFRLLLRLVDRAIVVNSEVRQLLSEMGMPSTRVLMIPNAVDVASFHPPAPDARAEARNRLGLPQDRSLMLYVGRMEPVKGVDILIRGWSLLPHTVRSRALLVLVGDGHQRESLARLAESLGVETTVLFAGLRRSVVDFYWASDALVLPSRSEGLSNAMVEAMACGLPVVASAVGGARDIICDGKNGYLCERRPWTRSRRSGRRAG